MGRKPRSKSESAVYHIILTGNNHQQIFLDDEDYEKFLSVIRDCKQVSRYSLYAYCLMGNHIHLLLKEREEPIGLIMKRITSRYVYWYNHKYGREGHLFQGRYKSECVENEEYFFTVIRYIHQNPVKAGLCKQAAEYTYSSFAEFFGDRFSEAQPLCSVKAVFKMIDRECFYEYNLAENTDSCMEESTPRVSDIRAVEIIRELTECNNPTDFQRLPAERQREYIISFRGLGMSIRQICRLTGVSIGLIRSIG